MPIETTQKNLKKMENISKRGGKERERERESGKIQNYGVAPIKPSEH